MTKLTRLAALLTLLLSACSPSTPSAASASSPYSAEAGARAAVGPTYAGRFAACEPYAEDIERAVEKRWGLFRFPKAFGAQLFQESRCDPRAVSPVGAQGLGQIMPLTQREIIKHLNLPPGTSPWDRINIDMAAYYQSRQMAAWSSPRPDYERWRLGLGSYNAGLGSLLKAQKACGGARLWRVIETCLPQITGGNAHETQTYVVRIERWWRELGGCAPFAAPRELQGEWGCP